MKIKVNSKLEEVTNNLVHYMYDRDPYEFHDCYDTEEDAFNDFYPLLKTNKGINNILYELNEDISCFNTYLKKDNEEETNKMIERAYALHKDITNLKKEMINEGFIR